MVSSSRTEGGAQVLSADARRTVQSIREVVRNHSDADVYVALKENNMDPYETIQRLLNQDPFHLVKRRRDRRQENKGNKSSAAEEVRKNIDTETVRIPVKNISYVDQDHESRRVGAGRNVSSGANVEFRVVRDNRIGQNVSRDSKPAQSSTGEETVFDKSSKSSSGHQKRRMGQTSQIYNVPTEPQPGKIKNPKSDEYEGKEIDGMRLPVSNSLHRQMKANNSQLHSSSSDHIHVPSPYSQSAQNEDLKKSARLLPVVLESDESSKTMITESFPNRAVGGPVSTNQHSGRSHHNLNHRKASQPNKEWKPKSTVKPSVNGPGAIKSPEQAVSPPADNAGELKEETIQMQDNMSALNLSENPNVIIAAHIHVSESDRSRLTFGSLGTQFESLNFTDSKDSEELSTEPSDSIPMSTATPESLESDPASTRQLKMTESPVQSSGSISPALGVESDQQLHENKESLSPQHHENYASVGLVQNSSPSYNSEPLKHQETSELPSFTGYEPQMDMSYFHPVVDETITGPGLPSPQEVLNTNVTNSTPASSISMLQHQQQQHIAQMYPPMHASQFANLMQYRQFLPPVYVPPMPVPAYSNNPAYPHPSNGSSYLLMPGNNSHLPQTGVKYGMQQFKPVPSGTGFGNLTSPAGYAIGTPGLVGSTEDASRIKYNDSLYVQNPQQAETSEIWMNPRDIPGLQSASYYNISGQTPPAAYLTSHSGHVSFNPAAAAQSPHVQFQGMYHPPPQPNPIASPHPLGPTMGANVGVGVASSATPAQIVAYQQPQMGGHMSWTPNF